MKNFETSEANKRFLFAKRVVHEMAELITGIDRADILVAQKEDDSPVTQADRQAETHFRSEIGRLFPDDSVIGEEFEDVVGSSGFVWQVDPIDGTRAFINGEGTCATSVYCERDGVSIVALCCLVSEGN